MNLAVQGMMNKELKAEAPDQESVNAAEEEDDIYLLESSPLVKLRKGIGMISYRAKYRVLAENIRRFLLKKSKLRYNVW